MTTVDYANLAVCQAQDYQSIMPRRIWYSRNKSLHNAVIMSKKDYNKHILARVIIPHRNRDYNSSECQYVIVGNLTSGETLTAPFGCLPLPSQCSVRFHKAANETIQVQEVKTDDVPEISIKMSDFKLKRVYVDSRLDLFHTITNNIANASGVLTTEPSQAHYYICNDEDVEQAQSMGVGQVLGISQVRSIVV